ncbi:hypothetical protein L596_030350 [Steinernema carpocapsae]|uniref:SKP1 component POZ domain-containing protein n=1 Tax=Steinernema carpocapsae TaxID=34508 RepID=A0A4U5LP62_STECR|nr:hypothetical protein L596_030350 [Steinernema carpocapsae]
MADKAGSSTSSATEAYEPVEKMLKLRSSDDKNYEIPLSYVYKADMLQTMLRDLNHDPNEGVVPSEPVPLMSVASEPLEVVIEWLNIHATEQPRSTEERNNFRFNRVIPQVDTDIFTKLSPRPKLAAVVNAAFYLEIPDLVDSLVKFTANNLEGKSAQEMSDWLQVPMNSGARRRYDNDVHDNFGLSLPKRDRIPDLPPGTFADDPDMPGTSAVARAADEAVAAEHAAVEGPAEEEEEET